MLSRRFATAAAAAARTVFALGLVAALLLPTYAPPNAVRAAAEPEDPVARLQVVVKSVYIRDARESWLRGEGDIVLRVAIWRCNEGIPPPCFNDSGADYYVYRLLYPDEELRDKAGPIAWAEESFGSDSGETVRLNRLVPRAGDRMWGGNTSEQVGFALYAGRRYVLTFVMIESDPVGLDDWMGQVFHFLDTEENGLGIGTHTASSSDTCIRGIVVETKGPCYDITYEIRRTPLPDLKPIAIRTPDDRSTAGDDVCVDVQNTGPEDALSFDFNFRVDGLLNKTFVDAALAGGQTGAFCMQTNLPDHGRHQLSVFVDEGRKVAEMDELNNELERLFFAIPVAGVLTGVPDLVVTSLEVFRQANGTGACAGGGTNYLFLKIMNKGSAAAGPFVVGLEVRGDRQKERLSVQGLAAGATNSYTMPTDDLKSGPQTVKVIADVDNQVSEQDETNNARQVTADCD